MSSVMAIDECPSRSWTILGWTLDASMWLAWLCRSLCRVTPHSFRKAETTCVRLRGCSGEPSACVTTCRLSSAPTPSRSSSSACATRQRRSSSTASEGRATVRRLAALGFFLADHARVCLFGAGDNGQLPEIEVDRLPAQGGNLATAQAAQRGQHQRNEKPTLTRRIEHGCRCGDVDRRDRLALDLRPDLAFRAARRGCARSASSVRPDSSAENRTRCMWWTVRGDSPPLPSHRPLSSACE